MTLIKANNYRLKVAREKKQKWEEIVKKQKIKAIAIKIYKIEQELVYPVKKKRIMKVIPKIIRFQTKLIINTYYNTKSVQVEILFKY